ncbi:hypothetical protein J3R30DRAFT_3707517 [Lentinula aciculospora]|uniref:RanBP2-type domain-containing protein n=1 Tax=Lentinula aciculospora TaxID=153920 RepID=A0A9W9A3U3_9AGAR|nr:hypothetical protein J3R30DRAFT_3707517 [Lentinula aciculospora]
MSGPIRRDSRNLARSQIASPYGRLGSRKSAGVQPWSISNIIHYFNPLRLMYPAEQPVSKPSDTSGKEDANQAAAAESLASRGHQISSSLDAKKQSSPLASTSSETVNPPPPSISSVTSSISPMNGHDDVSPESPQKGLDYLSRYLGERPKDEPLSSIEAEELISIIKKSTPVEEHETFQFSRNNPSTPLRGNSPLFTSTNTNTIPFSFSPSYINAPFTPNSNPSPSKLLKQNPNGSYRWEGGGSAKYGRSRNRYQSPAFGSTPRSYGGRLVLRESPEKAAGPIKTDTKRRRIGEEVSTASSSFPPSGNNSALTPLIRSPAPAPSPTRAAEALRFPTSTPSRVSSSSQTNPVVTVGNGNGNELKTPSVNGMKSSTSISRLRAPIKPTTPVVPSPLRQAWGQSPSSPTPSSKSSDDGHSQATKAASYISELIKEVTPVRNLDVSNPYQAASPVKRSKSSKPKPKPARRTRASGRPSAPPESLVVNGNGKVDDGKEKEKEEKEKDKEKDRDVLEKYSAQAIIQATLPKGSKRSRAPVNIGKGLPNGLSSARSPSPPTSKPKSPFSTVPQIEEVADEDDDEDEKSRSNKKSKGSSSKFMPPPPPPPPVNGHKRKAAGFNNAAPVIEEVDDEMTGQATTTTPSEVIEAGNSRTRGMNGSAEKSKAPGSGPITPLSFSSSPSNRSSPFGTSGSSQKISAIPREPSKLRFSYKPEPSTLSEPSSTNTSESAPRIVSVFGGGSSKSTTSSIIQPSPAPNAFSFGMKVAETPAPISSSSAAVPVASASKPKTVADPKGHVQSLPITSLPIFSFDDEQPVASGSGLSSDSKSKAMAAAKEFPQSKLPLFDFDSPPVASTSSSISALKVPSQAPKSFDWNAAGIKAPESVSEWTCAECMLKNKDSVAKCVICDADRPGAIVKIPIQSFDWSAAGMKKPGGAGADAEWTCSDCMLKNSASAVSKCTICDAPRPSPSSNTTTNSASVAAVGATTSPFKAPIQSFNWGAAGLKPPEPKAGVWDCSTCGLANPEKTMKCEVCDSPK